MAQTTYSSVPAVMEAMYTQFTAASGLSGIQVSESFPGGDHIREKSVFLGDVRSTDVHIPINRPVRVAREENYLVDVHAQVQVPGSTARPAREAVFVLYHAIEDVLANNPTLGVDGVVIARPANFDLQTGISDQGMWSAFLKIEVQVQSRLY